MTTAAFDPSELKTPVTVIYDGSNAAADHEIRFLLSRNRDGRLKFVDLATASDAAGDYGLSAAAMKEKLIARDASGEVLTGTDALYAAHAAIGLAAWFEMCRLPGFLSVGTGIRPKN